ncbi:unnamed protein product, partial [Polarella glacialis]
MEKEKKVKKDGKVKDKKNKKEGKEGKVAKDEQAPVKLAPPVPDQKEAILKDDNKENKDKKDKTDKKDKKDKKYKKERKEKRAAAAPAEGDADEARKRREAASEPGVAEAMMMDDEFAQFVSPDSIRAAATEVSRFSGLDQASEALDDPEADFWGGLASASAEVARPETAEDAPPEGAQGSFLAPPEEVEFRAGPEEEDSLEESVTSYVPEDSVKELARKLPAIAYLASGARLVLKGTVLKVTGPLEVRARAERYAASIAEKRFSVAEHNDVSVVSVLQEFASSWRGQEVDLEEELGVVITSEILQGRAARSRGQLIAREWEPEVRPGRWQPATVARTTPGGRVVIAWCYDGSTEEVDAEKCQPAVRMIVFGPPRQRAIAVARILTLADEKAQGVMSSQLAALLAAGDAIGGVGAGPSGYGIQNFTLPLQNNHWNRLLRQAALKT